MTTLSSYIEKIKAHSLPCFTICLGYDGAGDNFFPSTKFGDYSCIGLIRALSTIEAIDELNIHVYTSHVDPSTDTFWADLKDAMCLLQNVLTMRFIFKTPNCGIRESFFTFFKHVMSEHKRLRRLELVSTDALSPYERLNIWRGLRRAPVLRSFVYRTGCLLRPHDQRNFCSIFTDARMNRSLTEVELYAKATPGAARRFKDLMKHADVLQKFGLN
jgi:hypothetical protein